MHVEDNMLFGQIKESSWYFDIILGPHGNLALKENLSHTLKNKIIILIFFVFHDTNI